MLYVRFGVRHPSADDARLRLQSFRHRATTGQALHILWETRHRVHSRSVVLLRWNWEPLLHCDVGNVWHGARREAILHVERFFFIKRVPAKRTTNR